MWHLRAWENWFECNLVDVEHEWKWFRMNSQHAIVENRMCKRSKNNFCPTVNWLHFNLTGDFNSTMYIVHISLYKSFQCDSLKWFKKCAVKCKHWVHLFGESWFIVRNKTKQKKKERNNMLNWFFSWLVIGSARKWK